MAILSILLLIGCDNDIVEPQFSIACQLLIGEFQFCINSTDPDIKTIERVELRFTTVEFGELQALAYLDNVDLRETISVPLNTIYDGLFISGKLTAGSQEWNLDEKYILLEAHSDN